MMSAGELRRLTVTQKKQQLDPLWSKRKEYPRDDIDKENVPRKEGVRVLDIIEDSAYASIWGLEYVIKKSREKLIIAASNNTNNIGKKEQ